MKLLFVQGGTRVKVAPSGKLYTDGNLNDKIWKRYQKYGDELYVLLRKDKKSYSEEHCNKTFNTMSLDKDHVLLTEDITRSKKSFLSIKIRRKICKDIEKAVSLSDRVIIRSPHNYYTLKAIKYCKKLNKPYLLEVVGYAYDVYWNRGDLIGKLFAKYYDVKATNAIKNAPYCVYVTNSSLQKKYGCAGKTLGCSDVELTDYIDKKSVYEKRVERLNSSNDRLKLGTVGWYNLKLKGQQDVIRALYELKKEGINKYEYEIVGLGDKSRLEKLIKKYNLEDTVRILGSMPHNEIFNWLSNIDIYIQPSYSEGLCRAIVEAMSMSCPIIASDAGGNVELASGDMIFHKKSIKEIKQILENLSIEKLIYEAKRSFNESEEYTASKLDEKRDSFYLDFINNGKVL